MKTTLVITEQCNLDCRLCYGRCKDPKARVELSIDQWRGIIDDLARSGVIWLYIEGGEPFLKAGFVDLLAENTPRMFTMVRTHGTLVDGALAARLKAIDVGIVLVDLWGAAAATHDALTRTEGSFDRSVEGIRRLVDAGVETQMLFILNRNNVAGAAGLLRPCAATLGATAVGILRLYPLGMSRSNGASFPFRLRKCQRLWHRCGPRRCAYHAILASTQRQLLLADVGNQCLRRLDRLCISARVRGFRQRPAQAVSAHVEPSARPSAPQRQGRAQLRVVRGHTRFARRLPVNGLRLPWPLRCAGPFDLELNDGIDLTTLPG